MSMRTFPSFARARGVAWAEVKQAAPEFLLCLLLLPLTQGLLKFWESRPNVDPGSASIVTGMIGLPLFALLLGAGSLRSLPVLRRMPVAAGPTAALLLALRLGMLGILYGTWRLLMLLLGLDLSADLKGNLALPAAWLCAAVVAACFVQRPLAAVVFGFFLGLLATAIALGTEGPYWTIGLLVVVAFGLLFRKIRGQGRGALSMAQLRKGVALTAVGLVALFLICDVSSRLISWRLTVAAEKAAKGVLPTGEELRALRPAHPTSAAAVELARLVRTLGIELRPKIEIPPGDDASFPLFKDKWSGHVADYLAEELAKTESPVGGPPPELRRHLERVRDDLATARGYLIAHGDAVEWLEDTGLSWEAPIPNLLGSIKLTKLLLADALVAAHDGEHERAVEDLQGAAAVSRTMEGRPELISQLIRVAEERMRLRTLRRIPGHGLDAGTSPGEDTLAGALGAELEVFLRFKPEDWGSNDGLDWLRAPYYRVLVRWNALELARWSAEVEASGGCFPPLAVKKSYWSYFSLPNIASALRRASWMSLEAELTERVLTLRRGGEWTEAMEESTCPEVRWVHEFLPDGGFKIRTAEPIEDPSSTARDPHVLEHTEAGGPG